MKYWQVVLILASLGIIRTSANYCHKYVTCYNICTKSQTRYTSCGMFGWDRCLRYKTVTFVCARSCRQDYCCAGYTGNDCSSPICSTPCRNGGSCIDPDTCSCPVGFATPYCDVFLQSAEVNECHTNNGGCSDTCVNTYGSYECQCPTGFSLDYDQHICQDVDECSGINNGGCSDICENNPGSYTCSCVSGYSLNDDGHTCSDVNECSYNNNGGCSDICENTPGSYTCGCVRGYSLNADGHTCSDIEECNTYNGGCENDCTNTQGSYECSCNTRYYIDLDRHSCTVIFDINECSNINNGGCSDNCENTPGSYTCGCDSGYSLNDDGHTCSDIDECNINDGGCDDECINTQGSYECSCNTGYYTDVDGHSCKDIDECILTFNGGCQDNCSNTPGSFECSCHDSSPINTDGKTCASSSTNMTVFQRHGIIRKQLPRGCSALSLVNCDDGKNPNILLTSTSPWYLFQNDSNVLFTFGIVFVETGSISLPVSISGVTIFKGSPQFSMAINTPTDLASVGNILQSINDDVEDCLSVDFTISDINEFVQSNSFLNSFFGNMNEIIPDWLSFTPTNQGLVSHSNFDSYLVYGRDIDDDQWCRGAPVESSHMYHVLRYDDHLQLRVYGDEITLPKPNHAEAEKVCFIIDLCQESGTTFFVIFPQTVQAFLSNLQLFQALTKGNVQLLIRGFGLSLNHQINVHYHRKSMTFWNGDHVFDYPVFENANIWLGADYKMKLGILEFSGNSDLFIGIPSIKNILVATFKEEWNILFDLTVSAQIRLEFKLFGEDNTIITKIGGLEIDSYASLGGLQERRFCGTEANPPGLFFAMTFKVNPFSSIPILRDWIFDLEATGYMFVVKEIDNTPTIVSEDIIPILLELRSISRKLIEMTTSFLNSQLDLLTAHTIRILNTLIETLKQFFSDLHTLIGVHDLAVTDLTAVLDAFGEVWSHSLTAVKLEVRTFLDSVEFNVNIFHTNLTYAYNAHLGMIGDRLEAYIEKVTSLYTNSFKQNDGFGIHAYVDILIYNLTIPKVTIDFVYSVDSLGACSRYTELYKLFENREAARVYGEFSSLEIKIGKFLQLHDTGFEAAFSVDEAGLFLIRIRVQVSLLGTIPISTDLIIKNNGIYYVYEAKVWNYFPAQLTVSAELGKDWYDLTYSVIGEFLAHSDNDDTFGDSYMSNIRRLLNDIGKGANNRLTEAQAWLTKAQKSLSEAQSWLKNKQDKLRDANYYFDNAVADLKSAKEKVEDAKAPFERAVERLRQAQRDVDNLCRIQTCNYFCVPGLRFKLCKGWWGTTYPCTEWTSCLFRQPNPICVSKNAFCRIIRGTAYIALEAAQVFVRAAMKAMDAAKAILSVAQFMVDKSRVVLDIASVAVDVAHVGLEAAKGILEKAKRELEKIKIAVRIGLEVFGWIIQYGTQSLIDVRNCRFEARIKTTDLPVLSVQCEIKLFGPLGLDWTKVGFEVNFRRLLQSLWEAAKLSIDQLMSLIGDVFGRKRRDIAHSTKHLTYKIIRETRDADISLEALNSTINKTIFVSINNVTNDYDYRVLSFTRKCSSYKTVFAFLNQSVFSLLEMTNATASILKENGTSSVNNTMNIKLLQQNMALETMGIDLGVASDEYNITLKDMQVMLSNFTNDFGNDLLIQEISQLSNTTKELQDEQIELTDHSSIIEIWILAMENSTGHYFDNTTCVSLIDCVHHSLSVMYDIFYAEDTVNTTLVYEAISQIEDAYLELFGNETSIILGMNNAAERIRTEISTLDDICPFCYSAPTLSSPFTNVSVEIGKNAYIICNVTGDPEPTIWWFKNEDYLQNATSKILAVKNVTQTDGAYKCVAGNAVANLSTPEVFVNIMVEAEQRDRIQASNTNLTTVIIIASSVTGVIVIGIALVILWRLYVRYKIPTHKDIGSFGRPISGQSAAHAIAVSEFEKGNV